MRHFFKNTSIFFILSFALSGCSSIQKHNYSKEYYQSLGNNITRLVEMRTGTFVQYLDDADGKYVWRINEGKDSTITLARQIGNPTKDGYWILTYCFMTHSHEDPLSVTLEHYEYLNDSRDTILCKFHDTPEELITWKKIVQPQYAFNDLDLENIKKSLYREEFITLVREDLMQYKGSTNFKKASLYADKYKLRRDAYQVIPQESQFTVFFYPTDEKSSPYQYPATQVLVKLPIKNDFYPNGLIYKSK
jgi:uncharacterized protein YceK